MRDPKALVQSYLGAVAERDFERARSYLTDVDFNYTSPIGHFDSADRFIESLSAIGPILEELNTRRLFVSESEVIVIIDARITLHGYVTRTTAMLFGIENEYIKTMEAIFDATKFNEMFITDEPEPS